MAVQFILGSAGAGKSHKLYELLTERAFENRDVEYVAIVPEQYSMESQKEIINIHKNHGAFNAEVVSFNRLALGVFEEMGLENRKIMDDLGKTLVLRKVLEDCKKDLKVYAKKIAMPGFVDKMKSTVSELEQYNIDGEILLKMMESSGKRPSLKYKLGDVATIYNQFHRYIEDKMITQEEVLTILCKYIHKSERIKNTEYFVDGFTGFTPIQKNVVDLLIRYAKNVTFAFTLPESETEFSSIKEQELFALSKKTILSIKNACRDSGVTVLPDIVIKNLCIEGQSRPYRARFSSEISHIEENIFRYSGTKIYDKECENISVHIADNPRKEAKFVASKIAEMMIARGNCNEEENNLRYRDIAVITGDMETYYRYLEEAFEEYNIPAFIDHKKSITANPFVNAIQAIIEIIEKDFSYESVFHYLRLGLISEEKEDIDRFENYVLMSGRRGYKSYSVKWDRQYKGVTEEELEKINDFREKFVESICLLRERIKEKNATVKDRIAAVYEFVVANEMQGKLDKMAEIFREQGDLSRASEYSQTYAVIIGLFDKVVEMLGDEVISVKEFRSILESGLESIKVGIIPPGVDTVMVGDIERTRLKDIKKVIFLIGANDGIIPKNSTGGGIISDVERDFLGKENFVLAPTARENAFTQKLYLYTALTKPSGQLFIAYSKANQKGEELRKSYLISVLEKMFINLKEEDLKHREESPFSIISKDDAFRYVAGAFNDYRNGNGTKEFEQVYSILKEHEEYRSELLRMTEAAFYKKQGETLSQTIAAGLYGLKDNIGITRLERFAACAYSQFVANGLKLNQRRHYELAAYDLGNLYHYSIDLFCKEIEKRNISWREIKDTARKEIVDYCVKTVISQYDNDVLSSTARNLYITDRVRRMTDKTVQVLGYHLASGEFEPKYYEMTVNHGRIDRVDIFENDDRMYVKVIDYKSGNKKFSLEDTFYGLELQLMVYLSDVIEREKELNPGKTVLPGGAFYYGIKDPYIEKPDFEKEMAILKGSSQYEGMSKGEIKEIIAEKMQRKEFRMSGIVNGNPEVLKAMDVKAEEERRASDIIALKYTQKGMDARGSGSVIPAESFNAVVDYAMFKTNKLQEEILNGDISLNPYEHSCTYCPYQGVCRFDRDLGDKYREKEKLNSAELMEMMQNKQDAVSGKE